MLFLLNMVIQAQNAPNLLSRALYPIYSPIGVTKIRPSGTLHVKCGLTTVRLPK